MSEFISHECGIALVRLKKPLAYYQEKYGTPLWGFSQLFLLMEKQHNRGQDGAGVACVKFDVPAGEPYMFRERNVETNPLDKIFQSLLGRYNQLVAEGAVHPEFPDTAKKKFDFCGELYIGHLRYGTSGRSEEHTSELQSQSNLVCRLLLEKKKQPTPHTTT